MAVSKVVESSASAVESRRIALIAASAFLLATVQAQAQQAQIAQEGRVIVTGEGDVCRGSGSCTDHRWRDHQGQERQGGD